MARQGNILSFDEAKDTVRGNRPSVSASKAASAKPSARKPSKRTPANGPTSASRPHVSGKQGAKPAAGKPSLRKASAPSTPTKRSAATSKEKPATKGRKRTSAQQLDAARKPDRAKASAKSAPSEKKASSRGPSTPSAKANLRAGASGKIPKQKSKADPRACKDGGSAKMAKFAEIKREYAKGKAGREFTKQFGDTTSSAASTGPRAALYKGEMGRQHRKAAQMQGSSLESPSGSKRLRARFDWKNSPKLLATIMVAVCLAISGAFLYTPAKQYYATVRTHDRLAAEYEAVQERNVDMQDQVNSLSTPEGIEDRARAEFGWVKEGENAVNVYGLASSQAEVSYRSTIPAGSIEAPETWYSPFLDVLFGIA